MEREGPGHQTCTRRLWGNAATVFASVILIQLESKCRWRRDAVDQHVTIMCTRGAPEELEAGWKEAGSHVPPSVCRRPISHDSDYYNSDLIVNLYFFLNISIYL